MKLPPRSCLIGFVILTILCASDPLAADPSPDVPRSLDPRLDVALFAAAPDIVHPVGVACDAQGRLLVIESHTHFRPKDYGGPPHDRVRILEDTDGDGRADKFSTYFEGTKASMDIAVHHDGSVYLATRNEILRLRDLNGNGRIDDHAEEKQQIVFLDTKGNYPHNGLSGLSFDLAGELYFGMGENLGESYKLVGADGRSIQDEGEGGNIFWCTRDGRNLRRVATGFWNPFGTCVDIFGRVFAVDNDPDASPPCRLLHVVEGGDYGYQFRYGRSGRHPFQSWNGQLYGTLPMVTGVGEGPCEILSYESDGLPDEYRGDLLVTSWADHRVERYRLKDRGSSFAADRLPFIQGGKDFRPVGLAVAPDGSLFFSDWVLADYNLHGRGAVWQARWKDAPKPKRPAAPREAIFSMHRPLREQAARELVVKGDAYFLFMQCSHKDARVRMTALATLVDTSEANRFLADIARREQTPGGRALAVRALLARRSDVSQFAHAQSPPEVRRETLAGLGDVHELAPWLSDNDPFLRAAAVGRLAALLPKNQLPPDGLAVAAPRAAWLLALREGGGPEAAKHLDRFLADSDEQVRLLAIKWVADRKLGAFRPQVQAMMDSGKLSVPLYIACATALARIDGQSVNEDKMAEHFVMRLQDQKTPPATRAALLRLVSPAHKALHFSLVQAMLNQPDETLRLEAVRTLNEHPDDRRFELLRGVLSDKQEQERLRAEALLGLAPRAGEMTDELLALAEGADGPLAAEALRALVQTPLADGQRARVEKLASTKAPAAELANRVLGKPFFAQRPPPTDTAAWLKHLEGSADAAAGRRVFFHPKLAACARCHRVDGRGADIGPDLSTIGLRERRHILESILQPSSLVAPHYQTWAIQTHDGRSFTGLLVRTYLDEVTYVDPKGNLFKLSANEIADSQPLATSIMPTGLTDLLTDQELRDLLAYLASRK